MSNTVRLIDVNDVYALFEANGTAKLHVSDIDAIPRVNAVDAVEVVRCGECKHLTISQSDLDNRELYSCYHPHGLMKINKNCYCSYGERKEKIT